MFGSVLTVGDSIQRPSLGWEGDLHPPAPALCAQRLKGMFGELRFPWEDQRIERYCPAVRVEFCPW